MNGKRLFQARRTLTPGGHPDASITVTACGDGLVIRITDPARGWYEVFLDTESNENPIDTLTEHPAEWGWQPPRRP
ncbi:hypothetical protein [Mycolicibacterium fortuitum]|uniref:hypothetical protein n=1 Tax=Mycolicibacterium fortuitum TaxID=1766 RepID=UPI001CE1C379|nr:hypothetical protein [Mycolicibacterium fortuitum]MCA4722407.1 hypothetical protein [Mycolicibacterium fortuitum]